MKTSLVGLLAALALAGWSSVQAAPPGTAADFATGNMADAVKTMDANGDGMISKDEYLGYEAATYDKDSDKFATGNMTDKVKAEHAAKRDAHMKASEAKFATFHKNAEGLVSAKDMVGYLRGAANK